MGSWHEQGEEFSCWATVPGPSVEISNCAMNVLLFNSLRIDFMFLKYYHIGLLHLLINQSLDRMKSPYLEIFPVLKPIVI